jgi:hypothetical protein
MALSYGRVQGVEPATGISGELIGISLFTLTEDELVVGDAAARENACQPPARRFRMGDQQLLCGTSSDAGPEAEAGRRGDDAAGGATRVLRILLEAHGPRHLLRQQHNRTSPRTRDCGESRIADQGRSRCRLSDIPDASPTQHG